MHIKKLPFSHRKTYKSPILIKAKKQFDENFTKPLLNTYNPITYNTQTHHSESSHNPVRILVAAGRQLCPSPLARARTKRTDLQQLATVYANCGAGIIYVPGKQRHRSRPIRRPTAQSRLRELDQRARSACLVPRDQKCPDPDK